MKPCINKNRIVYLDLLRICAIFSVIVIHVSAIAEDSESDLTGYVGLVYNSMVRWAVPIFFMISGAMFLRKDKNYTFAIMIKKYIPRLLICIIFWGFLYSLLDIYLYSNFSLKTLLLCFINVFSNNSGYHLWFLYALIALYIMVPLFRIIVKNLSQKQLIFVIMCWMILSLGIAQFNLITKTLSIPVSINWYFPMISGYAGYFLLGYYLMNYDVSKMIKNILLILGTLALALGIVLNVVFTKKAGYKIDAFLSQDGISSCLVAISVFLIFKSLFNRQFSVKVSKIIKSISQHTFGIYLIHVFVISVIFHIFNLKIDLINSVISIPIFSLLVFILSYILIFLFSNIPILKKVVM